MSPRRPALFERFGDLEGRLSWVSIARRPSPVAPLDTLRDRAGAASLWIKRDDRLSKRVAGNKVRKLEWLLGDATARGKARILTVGALGSNHVLATTAHAAANGLKTEAIQFPGPTTERSRRVIRATEAQGVHVIWCPTKALLPGVIGLQRLASRTRPDLRDRYWIPAGGTCPLGTIGYVDAALELAAQIEAGDLPEPAAIFVATGTGGTHAGLIAGCRLAGLETRVIGVRVVPRLICRPSIIAAAANAALGRLARAGLRERVKAVRREDVTLLHGHVGRGWGHPTRASNEAVSLLADIERVPLEPIYTGKTMSAMLATLLEDRSLREGPVLFWNTCSSARLEALTRGADGADSGARLPFGYRRFLGS